MPEMFLTRVEKGNNDIILRFAEKHGVTVEIRDIVDNSTHVAVYVIDYKPGWKSGAMVNDINSAITQRKIDNGEIRSYQ